MEQLFVQVLRWVCLIIEAAAALWVTVGFVYAFAALVAAHVRRQVATFRSIRLTFSRYLSLALEFQLAADILTTAIAPTFEELSRLAIVAVIRTGLNYFLSREIREAWEDEEREAHVVTHAEAPFHAGPRPAQA
jgi:uncharacterized membrane protein